MNSAGEWLIDAVGETGRFVLLALKALCFWRRDEPVTTVDALSHFVETRSKFVAQATLYGYVRTRVGTRYASMMEDDVFAHSVNVAKWEIYLACLADLAVYTVAGLHRASDDDQERVRAFAVDLVDSILRREETPKERPQGFDDVREAFGARVRSLDWGEAADGDAPFQGSLAALVEWAPIADELKVNDVAIVRNSMRVRWKKVRDQFESLIDRDAVLDDRRSAAAAPQEPAGAMPDRDR